MAWSTAGHRWPALLLLSSVSLVGCVAAPPESRGVPADRPPQVRRLPEPGWVEVRSVVRASDAETPDAARQRAIHRARAAAVEAVAGVRVRSSFLDFRQLRTSDATTLLQVLTETRADALVIDEALVDAELVARAGGYDYTVTLRARVLDRSAARDPDFQAEIRLDQQRFFDGDGVSLSVRASRDARIYVMSLSSDRAALLLPNAHVRDTRVAARQWLHFPDAERRARGLRLVARVPPGLDRSQEALLVVALRGDRELAGLAPTRGQALVVVEASGAGALLAELMTPLIELPADAWTFDQVTYEVLAR